MRRSPRLAPNIKELARDLTQVIRFDHSADECLTTSLDLRPGFTSMRTRGSTYAAPSLNVQILEVLARPLGCWYPLRDSSHDRLSPVDHLIGRIEERTQPLPFPSKFRTSANSFRLVLFNSPQFGIFLVVVLAVYWSLPARFRVGFLLLASYLFYGSWDHRFLILILISTMIDYTAALKIAAPDNNRARRWWLFLSLFVNLGILGFFKYFNFFVDTFAIMTEMLGMSLRSSTLNVVLPVGISFYTLQTMSYTIDVYRRQIKPTRDFASFAAFVAFFPQLVAGPIERFAHLYPQVERGGVADPLFFRKGFFLLLQGYVKKVVIADNLAATVDSVFASPSLFDSGQLLEAAILFTFQIYCDFSGYSDIARGIAYLLGIEIVPNFRAPLLSRSITEFWRRWHVSLSQWLRDYLYISLGGNRRGLHRTYVNLLATMLLGGLWHGADWKFVVWGGLHGSMLVIERALGVRAPSADTPQKARVLVTGVAGWAATFAAVVAIFIFFRAESVGSAWSILTGIAQLQFSECAFSSRLLYSAVALTLMDVPLFLTARQTWPLGWPLALRASLYVVLLLALIVLTGDVQQTFIYFAF